MYQEQENSVSNSRFTLPHMELSLRAKQDTNPTDNEGLVPLHYAASINCKEEVELLLKNGADIDVRNHFGATPLYLAVQGGHENVVKLLLKNGANINIADNSSKTVLHLSVLKGHTEITKLLLGDIETPSTSCSDISIEELQVTSKSYY